MVFEIRRTRFGGKKGHECIFASWTRIDPRGSRYDTAADQEKSLSFSRHLYDPAADGGVRGCHRIWREGCGADGAT